MQCAARGPFLCHVFASGILILFFLRPNETFCLNHKDALQRISRRGNYGAFLMDNLPLIRSLVEKLVANLQVPVSCKTRIFPNLQENLSYTKMLEEAGCSLLAVHGRTREEKDVKF